MLPAGGMERRGEDGECFTFLLGLVDGKDIPAEGRGYWWKHTTRFGGHQDSLNWIVLKKNFKKYD